MRLLPWIPTTRGSLPKGLANAGSLRLRRAGLVLGMGCLLGAWDAGKGRPAALVAA